ncbi:hypothetical protein [Spiroplasma ixodetis]|uniref:hypothetical protein n=1 Tax=Spiroplasma ixodetis TaxID=2141 RepID=UPI002576C63D|nr:hypothetical protein [Spiroplasma ixodetis]
MKINNYHHKEIKSENTILNEQSLTLAFESGNFYNWNENDSTNSIAGIFTNSQAQSYLLNKDGTYNNLDLQISNFIRFDDNLGIATLNNFHKSDDSNFINNSFLMTKNGISDDATAIETPNHTFTNFGNNILSTDIGADLINTDGKITNLVTPYHYGKGKTSFTTINATFGVFVGGDQNSYILKVDGNIKPININVPNPILLNSFVAINDNGGIIRDVNGQLFYLTIDDNGNATTKPLIINKEPLFSTTTVFFSKTVNNQGILNVNLKNSSKFFGQPYHLSITDSNDIKLTKINEHYMNNFILLNDGLGVFIDEQEIGYFVNELSTFTKIGYCANFQRINDNLGFINNNTSKLLLSDSKNNNWSRINTIKFTKTKDEQLTNFINSYIDKDKLTAVNRTNNWISNNNLILNVTNDELKDITINDNQPLLPNINNSITTIINSNSEINIKFKDEIITYHVLIYNQNILPTLDNSTNTNIKYVGIVNNNLYDINSTNTNDAFTINFNYDNTIQFVNIITIDSTTMNKMNLWTLKPKTTFKLNAKSNNNVYLLQTVNWNNISNWQYFTIYHGNNLPIIKFWTTDTGIKLWNAALKLNYTSKELENMNATEINNLRNLSVNWTINEARGNTLGYIISGFLSIGFILTIIAIIYDWYLKQQFKKKQSNTKTNVN